MLSDLITQWFAFIKERFTVSTVDEYLRRIEAFNQSLSHFPIDANEFEKYITNFATHHQARTTNSCLTALKSFYKWAENYGVENVARPVHFLKEPPPKVRCLSDKEYELILTFSKSHLHNAIQFLGNTGLRDTEFRNLTWQDFSTDLQFVHINGKGRKLREVPLNDNCRQLLSLPHTGLKPEFVAAFRAKHIFYNQCCELADRIKIERFGSHAIRHFFATRLIRAKVPLPIVSRILGHANTLITERTYLHLCPADLQVTDCLRF